MINDVIKYIADHVYSVHTIDTINLINRIHLMYTLHKLFSWHRSWKSKELKRGRRTHGHIHEYNYGSYI